jgi:hypothetical protein
VLAEARPGMASSQYFSDALTISPSNRSYRSITSPRYCLSRGVVASARSLRARAAAVRV